jgi:hypothetical protein
MHQRDCLNLPLSCSDVRDIAGIEGIADADRWSL